MPDGQTRPHRPLALPPFDWADPFHLIDQLNEEERMVAESARAYAQDKLATRVTDAYLNETVAPEIFAEMGEMGLLGVTIPEEYGGLGAGYVTYGLVAREVERVDSGYRSNDVGAILPRDVSDQRLRHRRAEAEIPPRPCRGHAHRLFSA